MRLAAILAVSAGGAGGALLRWVLGEWLNASFVMLPPGTLLANLLGGLLMGLGLAWIEVTPMLSPALKLLLTTGFLGGLTTFSTFSAEALHLLQRGALFWFGTHLVLHVGGTIVATWLGYHAFHAVRG